MSNTISRRDILKLSASLPAITLEGKVIGKSPSSSPGALPGTDNNLPQIINLDGEWEFTYDPNPPAQNAAGQSILTLPDQKTFVAKMPVPGYWDDHLDLLRTAPFWSFARFNPLYRKLDFPIGEDPPDAMLPYLMGVGYYRKSFDVPIEWGSRLVTLQIGGARVEAWVWLNGSQIAHHIGHSVPFEVELDQQLRYGALNTLIVALDNTSDKRGGTSLRGYQGRTAGLYRSVFLKITGKGRIKSCYLCPIKGRSKIAWSVDLVGEGLDQDALLHWKILEPVKGSLVGEGTIAAQAGTLKWETDAFRMQPWSDHTPKLYEVDASLTRQGVILDAHHQSYGYRLMERDGTSLRLNGKPVMLRGGTDHYYFPQTTMAPSNVESYRERIRKLKELGFNWIRFHTWTPSEEYMQAADELGVMLQVSPPVGAGEQEWVDIIKTCRKHPSVVIYCAGNEEYLDEKKISFLRTLADQVHEQAPDALFNPQEGLRGVEYKWGSDKAGLGPGAVEKPFPYNPRRLSLLREFSDVFGSFPTGGMLSYSSLKGAWRVLDEWMQVYERPILSHEVGIHGNYLNLDLEHRFRETRIGPDLFTAVRRNLEKAGLLHKATVYYRNSCAWMRALRKEALEMARKTKYLAGYDFLAAFDQNWHRTGYPCGITNDFLELKPGECISDVLKYNGESVLLLDCTNNRNFNIGDRMKFDVLSSLYGHSPLRKGMLRWRLADNERRILGRGEWQLEGIRNGMIEKLATFDFVIPEMDEPKKVTLYMEMFGGEYEIANSWDFWAFPKVQTRQTKAAADAVVFNKLGRHYPDLRSIKEADRTMLRILSSLDENALNFLAEGGRVLLLAPGPFPSLPTSFQMSVTGRVRGNLATLIEDHPLMKSFPHDGYCDWQFYSLLGSGAAVNFNELDAPFDPIIEVVSSFKLIIKQANLFEWKVGKGRLLVSTMAVDLTDPATAYLTARMISYAQGPNFRPRNEVALKAVTQLITRKPVSRQ